VGGCTPTTEWATAVAAGTVVRSGNATVVLDLDNDGDERTGWTVFYLHLATEGRAQAGQFVQACEPVGHPSCEGGRSTGTHVHIARKYNGEWVLADGPLAFNMEGWMVFNGSQEYQGSLVRYSQTVTACTCSDFKSQIASEAAPVQPLSPEVTPATSSQP
jgi:LasA protease